MTWQEYTAVWTVLLVGVFDTLAIAMGVGFVFALLIFVMDYSGRGVIHDKKRGISPILTPQTSTPILTKTTLKQHRYAIQIQRRSSLSRKRTIASSR